MIQRIRKCYVNDDIVQLRMSFSRNITLISSDFMKEGVLCHYDFDGDSQNINKYITDNRRNLFPYGNIPLYKEIYFEFFEDIEYMNYVNQILAFNKHYISITDNFCVRDRYIVRDGETAIMYSRVISIPKNIKDIETTRKRLGEEYNSKVILCITRNGHYINFKKKFSTFFNDKGGLLILNDEEGIKFKLVELIVKGRYLFMREYDIPFNDYTLEELKYYGSKIENIKEPRIYSKFNPNIDRRDVKTAKKLVRKLNGSK